MGFDTAKEHIIKFNLENRIMEFPISSATVKEAAKAVGSSEAEIAKTLSFIVEERPILIVVAGDARINNAKFKAEFHTKAKMIGAESVEILIGHAVGGVCPFGVKEGVDVYLDESLKRFSVIYPACGSWNSAVKVSIEELERTSQYKKWVDVCKV